MRLHNGIKRLIVNTASPRFRARRWANFVTLMRPWRGMRIIDLGGVPSSWRFCAVPVDLTIVNINSSEARRGAMGAHRVTFLDGDATSLPQLAEDSFDLVFSNSTIEHVGGDLAQAAFAREVRRLAPAYYVQTPSVAFPYEVHSGMPFWWAWPERWRQAMILRWQMSNPALADFVGNTSLLRSSRLRHLFPDAHLSRETFLGIPKSTIAYRIRRVSPSIYQNIVFASSADNTET